MLNSKNVFITGSNRGIGKAIVEEFAKNGANIIAHARKETTEFIEFIKTTENKYKIEITPVYFDFNDEEQIKSELKKLYLSKINVDVLVNSAGAYFSGLYSQTSLNKLKEIMNIDFFVPFQITQIILKIMVKQKSGVIINMSSIAGIDMTPNTIAYSSAKASIIAMTKNIASEYGQLGIRCNAVAPGLINTDMIKNHTEEEIEYFNQLVTLKRQGIPEDVAKVVKFLASDDASYINGQVIRVDGGIK